MNESDWKPATRWKPASRRGFCAGALTALGAASVAGLAPLRFYGADSATPVTTPTYNNPVLAGDHPDAGAIRVGEDYYLTHSSFNYTPGLVVYHSRSLVDWTPVAAALKRYVGVVWAPFLCEHRGVFYIYFPANARIHVVHAPSPLGPWSDPVDLDLPGIDPGHVARPDGRRFLYLAAGRMVELAADGLSRVGEPRQAYPAWPVPRDWRIECECLEAPKPLFKDGYYYLNVAEGGTAGPATSHMAVSMRSRNVDGPWEFSPFNPIAHTRDRGERWWSQGHGRLVDSPDGRWWMVLHGYENGYRGLGRQTLLLPVVWTKDGWFRVPEGVSAGQSIPRPPGRPAPNAAGWSDDFTAQRLDLRWQFWNGYDAGRFSTGSGKLVLRADGSDLEKTSVLATVAGDHAYSVEIDIEIEPGCKAGLMLFYDGKHMCGLGLGGDGIEFRMPTGDTFPLGIPATQASFRLVNDRQEVDLYYRLPRGDWKKTEGSMEVSGLNQNVLGGFLSLRPAIYAAGSGQADFRNFRYERRDG